MYLIIHCSKVEDSAKEPCSVCVNVMMQSNLKVWTQRWERITSAKILSKLLSSVPTDALYLLLDIIQLCAHATADAINQACEVKGQQARCPDLL